MKDAALLEDARLLRDAVMNTEDLLFYTADGHSVSLRNWYKGKSVFLLCNGPSLNDVPLEMLRLSRGVVTAGMNNGWLVYRPDLWFSVDTPGNFADTGWKDPSITKFIPLGKLDQHLRVKEKQAFRTSQFQVKDMPACWYYRRNTRFNSTTYLNENTVNWGCEGKVHDDLGIKGARSVMLATMRILVYLGFKQIYLVGCDFHMRDGRTNYAFEQGRTAQSVKGNNGSYQALNRRFTALRPSLEERGVKVWNCTESSGLLAFKHLPFYEAVRRATAEASKLVDPAGWYEQDERKKKAKKK